MRKIKKEDENFVDDILIDLCEYVSEFVYNIGLTPNMITTLSLVFGVLAGYLLYKKMYYISCVFWMISYFLDCLDGYIARKYNQTSKFGDYYDHISDIIKVSVVLYVLYKLNIKKFYNVSIVLGIFGLFMVCHLGCQEKQYGKNDSHSLSLSKMLCPNIYFKDISSTLQITKCFGCGTFNLIIILCFIYYSFDKK
jgi:phosphatidylglycerophosphate synthase